MIYFWANPQKIGVVRYEGNRTVYLDRGDEYENAIAAGPEPHQPPPETILTPSEIEAATAEERTTMTCTPMQGILALGEANWNTILAYRATASWSEQVIIDSAQTWERNSQNIAFFQYLLGFTDAQVDDLFRAAVVIEA